MARRVEPLVSMMTAAPVKIIFLLAALAAIGLALLLPVPGKAHKPEPQSTIPQISVK